MSSELCLPKRGNDSVHLFMNELTSRVVAESGIPIDRFHLGKIILQSLKDAPNFILQIDGGTGKSETFESVLRRSVKCAVGLRNLGLQKADVMVLMGPNHIDLAIPLYAALYLGIAVAAVDRNFGAKELQGSFRITKPKVIFCHSEKVSDIQLALNELAMDSHIVTFDKAHNYCSFNDLIEEYGNGTCMENFKPTNFDPEETIGFLISTSGTSGTSKVAAITHKHFSVTGPYLWARYSKFPTPTRMTLIVAPLQWLTSIAQFFISPILRYTRLQSSSPVTQDHLIDLINTYKPTHTIMSPTIMAALIKSNIRERCDLTCFEMILIGGSAVPKELLNELKNVMPDTECINSYGITEIASMGFHYDSAPLGSCGKPMGCLQYRIVDTKNGKDIHEANVSGELWIKGICNFKGYYNDYEANKESFTADGWFKTGDLFYRDENWNFYFIERIKLLLKYKNYQVSPVEIEAIIRQHPGVLDVAVSSIPDLESGDLPVACVILRDGYNVTAQTIKNIVKESLSEYKQLRGGVIFMDKIPVLSTTKVDRKRLKELVIRMDRE